MKSTSFFWQGRQANPSPQLRAGAQSELAPNLAPLAPKRTPGGRGRKRSRASNFLGPLRSLWPGPTKDGTPSPCLDCTFLLVRLWQPLPPLRLAAPEAPAEQQGQQEPGGSWHRGGPERIHFWEPEESLLLGPLPGV